MITRAYEVHNKGHNNWYIKTPKKNATIPFKKVFKSKLEAEIECRRLNKAHAILINNKILQERW